MPLTADVTVLGLDPDTQGTGVAICTNSRVVSLGVCENIRDARGHKAVIQQVEVLSDLINRMCVTPITAAVIEVPVDYGVNRRVDPNKLILLSMVSGAAAAVCRRFTDRVLFVKPSEWKGQRKKEQDHKLTLDHFNFPYAEGKVLAVPEDTVVFGKISDSHWKEAVDAMGISWWYLRRLLKYGG